MSQNTKIYVLTAVIAVVIIGAAAYLYYLGVTRGSGPGSGNVSSNGGLIYDTGIDADGNRISFSQGPMWLYVHGGGCADCHGYNGRGGVYPMMCGVVTPDVRYSTLTEHGMTRADVERAITEGVDEDGEALNYCMPRWDLDGRDLSDLLSYLMELG
jgi:cytochrome c oxidase subunit 2